ncbi:hypothetical protein AQUCO_00700053v1 [Aquilegia coerulea]|uniref:Uncharacterized protein n=1 Tax=Aquilegia coerulea TaxID=218851 RepID=A0A2G5EID9_AQUCA|nr:hypothetical protein AQUCO_00700053v1 [Aquilegia coerulea]
MAFLKDWRGPEWKQGWTNQTLSSISFPPFPLIIVFAIVVLFLSLPGYTDYYYKKHKGMEHNMFIFRLLLFLLFAGLIFVARNLASTDERFGSRLPNEVHDSVVVQEDGHGMSTPPWGVALLLLLLLWLIFYKSY